MATLPSPFKFSVEAKGLFAFGSVMMVVPSWDLKMRYTDIASSGGGLAGSTAAAMPGHAGSVNPTFAPKNQRPRADRMLSQDQYRGNCDSECNARRRELDCPIRLTISRVAPDRRHGRKQDLSVLRRSGQSSLRRLVRRESPEFPLGNGISWHAQRWALFHW